MSHADIFGVYALQQHLQLHYCTSQNPILRLEEDHYGFVYCPEGPYYLQVPAGTTVIGFYAVAIDWLKRYRHSYLIGFDGLLEKALKQTDRYVVLGPLPMHALISDEWLLLASLPEEEGIIMDVKVYRPLATLLHIAQADLLAGKPKTHLLAERLEVVKHHIGQLGLHAAPFSVALVAGHFGFSQQHLIREFRLVYHITPKQYYLAIHLGECRRMLRDKHMTVKEVAYQRGYTDVRHFIRQYKKQFGKSPGDH
ncbi:Helix-turn-helix domain-containing protein [bacterium A37T11]|nr:Helix-turn-helix domain-containing protein [bacterium A37T11]